MKPDLKELWGCDQRWLQVGFCHRRAEWVVCVESVCQRWSGVTASGCRCVCVCAHARAWTRVCVCVCKKKPRAAGEGDAGRPRRRSLSSVLLGSGVPGVLSAPRLPLSYLSRRQAGHACPGLPSLNPASCTPQPSTPPSPSPPLLPGKRAEALVVKCRKQQVVGNP